MREERRVLFFVLLIVFVLVLFGFFSWYFLGSAMGHDELLFERAVAGKDREGCKIISAREIEVLCLIETSVLLDDRAYCTNFVFEEGEREYVSPLSGERLMATVFDYCVLRMPRESVRECDLLREIPAMRVCVREFELGGKA